MYCSLGELYIYFYFFRCRLYEPVTVTSQIAQISTFQLSPMETPLAAVRKLRHEPPYQTPRSKGPRSNISCVVSPTTPGRQLVAKELGLAGLNLMHSFQSHSLKVLANQPSNQLANNIVERLRRGE